MDTGKKLLMVTYSSVPSIDRHSAIVTGTVRALNTLFESVDIVAIKGDYLAHIERFHTCRLLRVPLSGETAFERGESFRRAVRRQIESDTYDVIHVRSPLEGIPITEVTAEHAHKVVYEAATFAVQDATDSPRHDEEIETIDGQLREDEATCASQSDLVIVHSEAARQALTKSGVTTPIELIPAGVNIDVFDWELVSEPELPTILCLGRLAPSRDVAVVIEAIRRVLEISPVRLRWAGEPNAERRELYRSYAMEFGIEHAVSFEPAPDVDVLPSLISSASICLAPVAPIERYLAWGDQPTGLLEFMACCRPVVAARVPGVEEIVRDGTEAMLYTPGDASGLTSGVLFLLRNPRHRELLAKRGYRRVREQSCESAFRRRVQQAYRGLLGYARVSAGSSSKSEAPRGPRGAQEPITAVMEAAEESRRVRIDGDTRRFRGPSEDEVRSDTQPEIDLGEANIDVPSDDEGVWVLPETTPHAKHVAESRSPKTTRPVTVEIEDTSRIASRTAAERETADE